MNCIYYSLSQYFKVTNYISHDTLENITRFTLFISTILLLLSFHRLLLVPRMCGLFFQWCRFKHRYWSPLCPGERMNAFATSIEIHTNEEPESPLERAFCLLVYNQLRNICHSLIWMVSIEWWGKVPYPTFREETWVFSERRRPWPNYPATKLICLPALKETMF